MLNDGISGEGVSELEVLIGDNRGSETFQWNETVILCQIKLIKNKSSFSLPHHKVQKQ